LVRYALEAVQRYFLFLDVGTGNPRIGANAAEWAARSRDLSKRVREVLRLKQRSFRTEKSYVAWVRRFLAFVEQRREPSDNNRRISSDDLRAFLSRPASRPAANAAWEVQRRTKL
jgi:hypothetical protein